MDDQPARALPLRMVRGIGRAVVTIAVVSYTVLDELLFPVFRPLIRKLSELRLFQRIGDWIGQLPPYAALAFMGVPFAVIEPGKLFALYWTASGHVVQGTVLLIIAHALSLLVSERIFHAGYYQMMQIGWFAALLTWLFGLRDRALDWVKSTRSWRVTVETVRNIRTWLRSVIASLR